MFNIVREEMEWGGRKLTLETGKVARQADGAVVATYGETVVLATVVGHEAPREGVDFFPLTVNYQERYYAAGKIPGGYFKRDLVVAGTSDAVLMVESEAQELSEQVMLGAVMFGHREMQHAINAIIRL